MPDQKSTKLKANLAKTIDSDEDSALAKSESKCSSLFDKITEFTAKDAICRANCLFCNHPLRAEAEEKYEITHSCTPVYNLLLKYHKENPQTHKIAYHSVRNHINKHYKIQERKWALREYAEKHNDFLQAKINQDERFQSWIGHLDMLLWEISSRDDLDTIKQVEAMTKLIKSMSDTYLLQSKLRGELDASAILSEKLTKVWLHIITKENRPAVKQSLMEALDDFQTNFQDIQIIED